MKLFVGLGNPGARYAHNRHNVGFMAVERIADDHGFSPWRGKFQGSVAEGRLGAQKVFLLKPETFMNKSGHSVLAAAQFYKVDAEDIYVFHDEIDLAPGKCRVKSGGGHAGHNGLRSLHAAISPDYHRIRIGVGHPGHKDAVPGYVLRDFPKADQPWLDDLLRGISDGAVDLAAADTGRFMNAVSLRVAPPRSSKSGAVSEKKPKARTPSRAEEPAAKGAEPPQPVEDTRSVLQKLVDKFKG